MFVYLRDSTVFPECVVLVVQGTKQVTRAAVEFYGETILKTDCLMPYETSILF